MGDDNHVSYVESSKYESETAVQEASRIVNELSTQLENAKNRLDDLKKRRNLDLLDRIGDRTVIRFAKTYTSGTVYHYAAIKTGGWWYITSDGMEYRKTDQQLKNFIGDNLVEIMTPDKSI